MGVPHIFWCMGVAAAATAIAWVAAVLNFAGKAPVGLLPLGIGLSLGIAIVGLAAIGNISGRRFLIVGAVVFAILTVIAEHAWLYHEYRQQWWRDRVERPAVALFRPETAPLLPVAYFAREFSFSPQRTALWAVDAAVIVATTVGVVVVAQRMKK